MAGGPDAAIRFKLYFQQSLVDVRWRNKREPFMIRVPIEPESPSLGARTGW